MNSRPVLVTGATGLVGGRLLARLRREQCPVRVLSRDPARAARQLGDDVEYYGWDTSEVPEAALQGAGAVVHLAGEPLFGGLPTRERRRRIRESRLRSTGSLVRSLGRLPSAERPEVLLCASAVGYYGSGGEALLDEEAPPGDGFLSRLCADWEEAARQAERYDVRAVSLRLGIVLAREAGALAAMLPVFRLGLGGQLGDGRQWMPWVHADDVTGVAHAALGKPGLDGPLNVVAPEPVRNGEFTRALAGILRRPALLRVPGFALRAALGPLADELLDSRRVVPKRATQLGYRFLHPDLTSALQAELGGDS